MTAGLIESAHGLAGGWTLRVGVEGSAVPLIPD
jgi:hypothetical protein